MKRKVNKKKHMIDLWKKIFLNVVVFTLAFFIGVNFFRSLPKDTSHVVPPLSSILPTSPQNETGFTESSSRCKKSLDIWSYLPEDIKKRTYKDGFVRISAATYDIIPLKWSANCVFLPFILEVVARDGFTDSDPGFKERGLYLYDDRERVIKTIMLLPFTSRVDDTAHDSNYWLPPDSYIFVVSTDKRKNPIVMKRYEYQVTTGLTKIKPD